MQHCAGFISAVTLHVSDVKRPSSGVFKTSTAATGTGVIVADRPPCQFFNTPDDGRLTPETCRVTAEIKPEQCCIKLVFYLTYTTMHGNTKVKFNLAYLLVFIF